MTGKQFDFLDTPDERAKKISAIDEKQLVLPVDPLQDQLNAAEIILTENELEIMQLVLTGVEIPAIAMTIRLSIAGIKWRLSSVYQKFQVRNRLQLIKKASSTGLQFRTKSGVQHTFHNQLRLRKQDEK